MSQPLPHTPAPLDQIEQYHSLLDQLLLRQATDDVLPGWLADRHPGLTYAKTRAGEFQEEIDEAFAHIANHLTLSKASAVPEQTLLYQLRFRSWAQKMLGYLYDEVCPHAGEHAVHRTEEMTEEHFRHWGDLFVAMALSYAQMPPLVLEEISCRSLQHRLTYCCMYNPVPDGAPGTSELKAENIVGALVNCEWDQHVLAYLVQQDLGHPQRREYYYLAFLNACFGLRLEFIAPPNLIRRAWVVAITLGALLHVVDSQLGNIVAQSVQIHEHQNISFQDPNRTILDFIANRLELPVKGQNAFGVQLKHKSHYRWLYVWNQLYARFGEHLAHLGAALQAKAWDEWEPVLHTLTSDLVAYKDPLSGELEEVKLSEVRESIYRSVLHVHGPHFIEEMTDPIIAAQHTLGECVRVARVSIEALEDATP